MEGELKHILTRFQQSIDEVKKNIIHAIDHNDFARAAKDWKELASMHFSQKNTPRTVVVDTGTEVIRSTIPSDEWEIVQNKTRYAFAALQEVKNHAQHKGVSAQVAELMK